MKKPLAKDILACQQALQSGLVVVLPTDTIYGLACSVTNKLAVQTLYKLKQRTGKPGTVLAANINQLVNMGLQKTDCTVAEKFWPNTTSVILPAPLSLSYVLCGQTKVAVRIPAVKWLQQLLLCTGPLLTSSVNITNQPHAKTIMQAKAIFGSSIPFYLNGGTMPGKSSTIVQVLPNGKIEVLRA